jgi:hypothetical protein
MAKFLDFSLKLDTKDAEKNVDNLSDDLENLNELTELELVLKSADAASSVKELNEAMEKLQSQALKFGQGSDEFIKAATKAGQLKKRMDDVNRSIDTVASGGQLGQITGAFDRLRASAATFDIEGVSTAFGLMKTQIAGAATAALGLGQGLNVATIAARGLAVALAATGITLVIAAVVLLISEFENLASAGGAVGFIFTSLGNAFDFIREQALELLDSLGLIDNAARKAAESQEEYLKNLQDEFDANGDAYDELTRKKTDAEINYLKKLEELNNRRDISEKRKNDLIELYNKKRIRAIETAEREAIKSREESAEKERLRQKQLATEAEARRVAEINRIKEALKKEIDLKVDAEREAGLKLIKEVYKLEAQGAIIEQQQIDRSMKIRLESQKAELRVLYDFRKQMRKLGYAEEEADFRENEKKILDLEIALMGSYALTTRQKRTDETRKDLEERARIIAQYRKDEFEQELQSVENETSNLRAAYSVYLDKLVQLDNAYKAKRIANEDGLQQLQIMVYEEFLNDIEQLNRFRVVDEAINAEKIAEINLQRVLDEKSAFFEAQDSKLRKQKKSFEEGKITAEEYSKIEKEIYEETANKRVELDNGVLDAKIQLEQAIQNTIKETTDYEISESIRAQEARIEAFNQFAGQVQNITGFISDQLNAISNLQQAVHERRLFEIEEEYTAQYNSLQAQYQQGIITEVALSQGLAQIEEQRRRAKYNADKKAFEQEKAIRITQAVMSTIQASLAAYSSGAAIPVIGTIMGPIFAGIAAAFGAAQIGMIASEKFPSYQQAAAPNISIPSPQSPGQAAGGAGGGNMVPPSFFANSGAVQGTDAMINPGGIYQAQSGMGGQVWVLESDITGMQGQVQVTEDRSYFDAGSYG